MGTFRLSKVQTMNFKYLIFAVLLSTLALTYGATIHEGKDDCKECTEAEKKAITECKEKDDPKKCAVEAMKKICSKEECMKCKTCKPKDECKECAEAEKKAISECKEKDDPKSALRKL